MSKRKRGRNRERRRAEAEREMAMKVALAQEEAWRAADQWRGEPSPRCHICGARLDHPILRLCTWCGAKRRESYGDSAAFVPVQTGAGGTEGA